jgi:general secretion pathway protein E
MSRLQQAVAAARQQGREALDQAVMAAAALDPVALASASREQLGLAYYPDAALAEQTPRFDALSFSECRQRTILPLAAADGICFVLADPWDSEQVQWLANRHGRYPQLGWGGAQAIRQLLEHAREGLGVFGAASAGAGDALAAAGDVHSISIESIERCASQVVRFVDAALYEAWRAGASDIHFECDRQGVAVKLRLDGVLVRTAALAERERAEEVISRIKVLAQLDIAERRVPQDGRFRVGLDGRDLDFRVSVMPSIFGEDAVIRLLDKSQLRGSADDISLANLGVDADAIERIRRLARRPHGMLLVTGPTGSGKTTTLYAALSEIRSEQEKIITIEDPVEYELPGVLQIPVNERKGLTFSQGLRSILRHDPDKILVGEIRDSETAEIAIQAALTGHLVFTTVHANSVFDVISRFSHMEVDLYSLVSALNGVVAQRLLRSNCPACSAPCGVPPGLAQRLQGSALSDRAAHCRRGAGCEACRGTGYRGRRALAEVLPFDDTVRALVLKRADVREIKQYALQLGVRPLAERALELVLDGVTTLQEVDRVIGHD